MRSRRRWIDGFCYASKMLESDDGVNAMRNNVGDPHDDGAGREYIKYRATIVYYNPTDGAKYQEDCCQHDYFPGSHPPSYSPSCNDEEQAEKNSGVSGRFHIGCHKASAGRIAWPRGT